MRQKMISNCTLPGIYGVAQMHNSKIYHDYEITTLPISILIDPEGIILYIGSSNDELLELLQE